MGFADVECVHGCKCARAKLNGRSDHRISVPIPLQFQVGWLLLQWLLLYGPLLLPVARSPCSLRCASRGAFLLGHAMRACSPRNPSSAASAWV